MAGVLLSIVFAVGPESLNFPRDARSLALSGSGVSGPASVITTPVSLFNGHDKQIGFSHNTWFGGITGQYLTILWGKKYPMMVDISEWSSGDVDLWGDVPSDEPLGSFRIHWVTAGLSAGYRLGRWETGIRLQTNYSRMVIESSWGMSIDLGARRRISDGLGIGFAVNNLGKMSSNELDLSLPLRISAGVDVTEPFWGSRIMADVVKDADRSLILHAGWEKQLGPVTFLAGSVLSSEKLQFSTGLELAYRQWEISTGLAFHENSVLGVPKYFTLKRTF